MKSLNLIALGALALAMTACGQNSNKSGGSKSKPVYLPNGFYVSASCTEYTSRYTDDQGNEVTESGFQRDLWYVEDKLMYGGSEEYGNDECSGAPKERSFTYSQFDISAAKKGFKAVKRKDGASDISYQFEVVDLGSGTYYLGHRKVKIDGKDYSDPFSYGELKRMASGNVSDADVRVLKNKYDIDISRDQLAAGAQGEIERKTVSKVLDSRVSSYEDAIAIILEYYELEGSVDLEAADTESSEEEDSGNAETQVSDEVAPTGEQI